MEFSDDRNNQGKRPVAPGDQLSAKKSKGKNGRFSVSPGKPNTDNLIKAWNSLSHSEMGSFMHRFGRIPDLLFVKPDWNVLRALMRFYIPQFRTFILPHLDLAPTLDEFHYLLHMCGSVKSDIYIPDVSKLKSTKPQLQEILRKTCGLPHSFTNPLVTVHYGVWGFNWEAAHKELPVDLLETYRLNFIALGIYGLVVFPTAMSLILPEVLIMFERLIDQPKLNLVPAIVAEMHHSMERIKETTHGRFFCSIELFTVWAYGHLLPSHAHLDSLWAFRDVDPKDLTVDDWYDVLKTITPQNIIWKVKWLPTKQYLSPPTGDNCIPLLGIKGGVNYTIELAKRQFNGTQLAPNLNDIPFNSFEYAHNDDAIRMLQYAANKWGKCELDESLETCKASPSYQDWKQVWLMLNPLPLDIPNVKEATIQKLQQEIKQNENEWDLKSTRLNGKINELTYEVKVLNQEKQKMAKDLERNNLDIQWYKEESKKLTITCNRQKNQLRKMDDLKEDMNKLNLELKTAEATKSKLGEIVNKQKQELEEATQLQEKYNILLQEHNDYKRTLKATHDSEQMWKQRYEESERMWKQRFEESERMWKQRYEQPSSSSLGNP